MKAVKLKLGTHMDCVLMYCVYQNQSKGHITLGVTSLDKFYNFAINENFMSHFSGQCIPWTKSLGPLDLGWSK